MFGLELHPALVHFPIALGVVGALFAIAYLFVRREWLRWFAPILLSIALLGAGAAYFSGESAKDRAEDLKIPTAAIEEHEESGIWAIGLVALATLLAWATHARRRGEWIAALVAAMAAAAFVRTGHLGGVLVYVHGAGHVTPKSAAAPAVPGAGGSEHAAKGAGDHD
jgi:uncharacterized membrane protein